MKEGTIFKLSHILICLFSLIVFVSVQVNTNNIYIVYFAFSLLPLVSFIIFHIIITGKKLSFSVLLILVSYLFNFGQLVLLALVPQKLDNTTIVLRYFSFSELEYGLKILIYCFYSLSIGLIIFLKKSDSFFENIDAYKIKKIGLVLFFITAPIKVVTDLIFLYVSFTSGFDAGKTWISSVPDFLLTYSNFSILAIALLIIAFKTNSRVQNKMFFFTILYILIIMMSGRRSENVSYVICLAYIYLENRAKKIRFSTYIVTFLLAFIFIGFLRSVVYFRNLDVKNFQETINIFKHVFLEENIIIETLREYGNTGYTGLCVITKYLPNNAPFYGKSYILGLSSIFPNVFGYAGEMTRSSAFAFILQDTNSLTKYYTNIGGSFFGEVLFNFGVVFSQVFILVFGLISSKVSSNFEKYMNSKKVIKLSFYILFMFATIYWTRDYFGARLREVIWGILVIYILNLVLFNREILFVRRGECKYE